MEVHRQLDNVRKEHNEILQFLIACEYVLERASSEDWDVRCHSLEQLHEMDREFVEISEHCRREEEGVESPFELYLESKSLEELRREHSRLHRLISDFRRELMLATAPRTADLVALGRKVITEVRKHIAEEEESLAQIEAGTAAEEKLLIRYSESAE
jgi:hemerythrin HHE cation binding domain-containing protein